MAQGLLLLEVQLLLEGGVEDVPSELLGQFLADQVDVVGAVRLSDLDYRRLHSRSGA